jgi:biopolymer transport protein TolQ
MNLPLCLLAAGTNSQITYIWEKATIEAKVIIIFLVIFSMFAWSIMVSKSLQMRRARRLNDLFMSEFRAQKTVLDIHDRRVQVEGCPLFAVYQEGGVETEARLKQADGSRKQHVSLKAMEHIKRTMESAVAREALALESGIILLALAVSGVWGVMDTFAGVAQAGRADLAAMAPGVAAALITTVAGLLVAIPSMFGYNWLVHNLRVQTVELDNFAQELASKLETEFLKDE